MRDRRGPGDVERRAPRSAAENADTLEAHLQGLDSLLSTVQMPKGIPVATFTIGDAGAANAALFAVALLSLSNSDLQKKLTEFRRKQTEAVLQAAPLRL